MTHPLIDEASVPMAVHAAEVRRGRTTLHRDRPDEDPAGAPSGLRWRLLEHGGWRLWRGDRCVGAIMGTPDETRTRPGSYWGGVRRESWESVAAGPIAAVARALVREVRRG